MAASVSRSPPRSTPPGKPDHDTLSLSALQSRGQVLLVGRIAISALGMKTQLKELAAVGLKPVALMIGETVFLAALVLGALKWLF